MMESSKGAFVLPLPRKRQVNLVVHGEMKTDHHHKFFGVRFRRSDATRYIV